jgi:hypothetical protein
MTPIAFALGTIQAAGLGVRAGREHAPARLSDAEIAAIVNFVRTELNPYGDLITADFVAGMRD